MYTLIYDFILTYLFDDISLKSLSSEILGVTLNMAEWLSHSLTIISMVLMFVFAIYFIKWLFKLVSGLFLLK